jgi:CheY-like chemotaxis protein
LPAAATAALLPAAGGAPPAGAEALAGKTVLVAEDDMRTLYSLANLLASWQVQALTAADGPGALGEVAGHAETDAILLDASLPGLEVDELARLLRGGAGADAPALVALAGESERESCEALALDGVLAKPVDPAQLVAVLVRVTRRS